MMYVHDRPVITIILGAGASRGVSYAGMGVQIGNEFRPSMPSPLDGDFFDLLLRLESQTEIGSTKEAMRRIIDRTISWKGEPLWGSMERTFYSLHTSEVMEQKFFLPDRSPDGARQLVNDFLLAIRALLKEAHGERISFNHQFLLQELWRDDAVLTFNYDFVTEMALLNRYRADMPFGDWVYGFGDRPADAPADVPTLYKLHGSLNWRLEENEAGETESVRDDWPEVWAQLLPELDYWHGATDAYVEAGRSRPPVLLPYWDKRVEKGVWHRIWRGAAEQLLRTNVLIIWGYSLPTTDLKAAELLRLGFADPQSTLRRVVVIDPSPETQDRWRRMFLRMPFFRFQSVEEFLNEREGLRKVLFSS